MTKNLPASCPVKDANVEDSVVRTSLGSKWDVETVPWNIRYDDVTAGNIVRSGGGNNSINSRLILQQCSQHRADVTQAMNIPGSNLMDGFHDFRIDSDAHHQECSPAIDDGGVEDFDLASLDDLSQLKTTSAEPQIFRQKVFGSQRKYGNGNSGLPIDKIGDSPVSASRNDAPKNALGWLFCQVAIQLRTA
jgi:hypothetical protein